MKNLLFTKFSLPRQKALTSGCVCSHPLITAKLRRNPCSKGKGERKLPVHPIDTILRKHRARIGCNKSKISIEIYHFLFFLSSFHKLVSSGNWYEVSRKHHLSIYLPLITSRQY